MKNPHFYCCLFFMFCYISINAQLLEKGTKGYRLNAIEYKTNAEIMELLKNKPLATKSYIASIRNGNRAKGFGIASLVSAGLSALFISQYPNPTGDSPNSGALVGGAILGVVSCITGSIGIGLLSNSSMKKKNVLEYYNAGLIRRNSKKTYSNLALKTGNNGMGVFLNY